MSTANRHPSSYSNPRHNQMARGPYHIPSTALEKARNYLPAGGVASKDFAVSWSMVMYPLSIIARQCFGGMLPSRPWCSLGRVHLDMLARLRPKNRAASLALPSKNCSKYAAGVNFCRILVDMPVFFL